MSKMMKKKSSLAPNFELFNLQNFRPRPEDNGQLQLAVTTQHRPYSAKYLQESRPLKLGGTSGTAGANLNWLQRQLGACSC